MRGGVSLSGLEQYGKDRSTGPSKRILWAVLTVALVVAAVVYYHYYGGPTTPTPVPAATQPADR